MSVESIGSIYSVNIPGLTDAADIQAAFQAYHYGSYTSVANTAGIASGGITYWLKQIETDIVALENRPSSGGEVNTTQPAASSFTPAEIPDGFIWVDQDGAVTGSPISATAVFTNSAPSTSLTTGTIWVDKDATNVIDNPFIPQAIIAAKGDLLAGSTSDTVVVLTVGTNGQYLKADSSTTSGLAWSDAGDLTAVSAGTGITVTNGTGPIPTVTFDYRAGSAVTLNAQTATYTVVLADADQKLVTMSVATANDFLIPTNANVAFPIGTVINVVQIGAGTTTIEAVTPGTTTIESTGATTAAPELRAQFSAASCIKVATDTWYVVGDIA